MIGALIERIEGHTAAEKILVDWKFEAAPIKEITGKNDLPCARLFVPFFNETIRPPMALVDGTMTILLAVSTAMDEGLEAHLEAVETVCDALELDPADNTFDPQLDDLLSEQMKIGSSVPEGALTSLSITTNLTITVTPRTCAGATRRSE